MKGIGRAAALGAAALLLLGAPLPLAAESPFWRAAAGAAHVGLFAGLAWGWGRFLSPERRGLFLWAGLALFAAAAEGLQPFAGRSAEWSDWLCGASGAACVCATWRRGRTMRWVGTLAVAVLPFLWEGGMLLAEQRAFPVLARPAAGWARRGWTVNGAKLSAAEEGLRLVRRAADNPPAYPGLFRAPARRDWRGMRGLSAELYWPSSSLAVFAIRIDDRPGNPPYTDRFQKEFAVTQGWNIVRISAEETARTAGGRPLRLDAVRQWGVFLVSDVPFDYFSIGPVGLDMQEENP